MNQGRAEIAGSAVQRPAAVRPLRPADPNQIIEVTIVIRRPAAPALSAGKSRDEIEKSLSADAADVAAVTDFVRSYELTVKEVSPPKRIVRAEGPVRSLNLAFGIQLAYFDSSDGSFLSYDGSLTVPSEVSAIIEAVLGLHQEPVAKART